MDGFCDEIVVGNLKLVRLQTPTYQWWVWIFALLFDIGRHCCLSKDIHHSICTFHFLYPILSLRFLIQEDIERLSVSFSKKPWCDHVANSGPDSSGSRGSARPPPRWLCCNRCTTASPNGRLPSSLPLALQPSDLKEVRKITFSTKEKHVSSALQTSRINS